MAHSSSTIHSNQNESLERYYAGLIRHMLDQIEIPVNTNRFSLVSKWEWSEDESIQQAFTNFVAEVLRKVGDNYIKDNKAKSFVWRVEIIKLPEDAVKTVQDIFDDQCEEYQLRYLKDSASRQVIKHPDSNSTTFCYTFKVPDGPLEYGDDSSVPAPENMDVAPVVSDVNISDSSNLTDNWAYQAGQEAEVAKLERFKNLVQGVIDRVMLSFSGQIENQSVKWNYTINGAPQGAAGIIWLGAIQNLVVEKAKKIGLVAVLTANNSPNFEFTFTAQNQQIERDRSDGEHKQKVTQPFFPPTGTN